MASEAASEPAPEEAWARTRQCDVPVEPCPGQERLVRPGGSGTPLVAEFLPTDAAARLGLGVHAAGLRVGADRGRQMAAKTARGSGGR